MSKKVKKEKPENNNKSFNLTIKDIKPLSNTQADVVEAFYRNKHLCLYGYAGTGKTFLPTYLALKEIVEDDFYQRLIIIRSVVPSRDVGFLPGTAAEKAKLYELPHINHINEICGRGDAYEILKRKRKVDFVTTSFLRGTTIEKSIVLIDEMQNMTFQELDTIITRIGKDCHVVFCGDHRQTDLVKDKEVSGLAKFISILKKMESFAFIEFGEQDICRSGLVREYIIEKENQK